MTEEECQNGEREDDGGGKESGREGNKEQVTAV